MKYKLKIYNKNRLMKTTIARFHSWQNAEWFLRMVLRYRYTSNEWRKGNFKAEIVATNGIPL